MVKLGKWNGNIYLRKKRNTISFHCYKIIYFYILDNNKFVIAMVTIVLWIHIKTCNNTLVLNGQN